jgi:hypothetical protein
MAGYLLGKCNTAVQTPVFKRREKTCINSFIEFSAQTFFFLKSWQDVLKITADTLPLCIINWLSKGYSNNGVIFRVEELIGDWSECNFRTHIIIVHYDQELL